MTRMHYELQSSAHPYCGACLERWPCKTVDLETRLTAADAAGREVARALHQVRAHSSPEHQAGCMAPLCRQIAAALANPVVMSWLAEQGEEEGGRDGRDTRA